MLLSNRLQRLGFIVLTLGVAAAMGACTLTPVYSGGQAESALPALAYAKPASRIEQIIYQDLALRLGATDLATAPLASVRASAGHADMVLSRTANPNKPVEVTVTATLTITQRDGTTTAPVVLTRQATANYSRSGQVLGDREAAIDAEERAAVAVAESLRLAVLATRMR
jgi:hypothetical protein